MPEIVHDAAASRYELLLDGEVAGFAEYRLSDDTIVFTHTEIREEFEGKGLGSRLVGGALDQVRETGRTVVPKCPFVARYIERHPEYRDLLAE
ncbi:N-acetyltransferase [Microtetraspora sp. AC03309]|uniref:GNAT family N-acetyltransferase n=1 Tax=Microtetraspora sp. AC03309 TaxID=2779376 RepID=UPI001E4EE9E6|nr:GNAT family N-acetyltransferase [Microtetraspora sp. AC03309]MCC5574285.1 N-acetyltransferase [Microtetraspora sp. AC03309]